MYVEPEYSCYITMTWWNFVVPSIFVKAALLRYCSARRRTVSFTACSMPPDSAARLRIWLIDYKVSGSLSPDISTSSYWRLSKACI